MSITNPDPILHAIDEYKRLRAIGCRLDHEVDVAGNRATRKQRQEADRAWKAEDAARRRLEEMMPSTPAGAAAALELIAGDLRGFDFSERQDAAMRNIIGALRAM